MLERPQALGLAGIVLIVAGSFVPLADVWGTITFYGGGHGDGVFAWGAAAIAGVLLYLRRYRLVPVVAAAIAALWLLTLWHLHAVIAQGHHGDLSFWGWLPLALGTACLFAVGAWRKK